WHSNAFFFFSSRRRHTRSDRDWSSDVCSSDLACKGAGYDPTRPAKGWRSAWRSLKKAAGMPKLRFHDLRHTCITKLAEAGVPDRSEERRVGKECRATSAPSH